MHVGAPSLACPEQVEQSTRPGLANPRDARSIRCPESYFKRQGATLSLTAGMSPNVVSEPQGVRSQGLPSHPPGWSREVVPPKLPFPSSDGLTAFRRKSRAVGRQKI